MTHEEFLRKMKKTKGFFNSLFKQKEQIESEIKNLFVERYKHLIGQYCEIGGNCHRIISIETIKPKHSDNIYVNARTLRLHIITRPQGNEWVTNGVGIHTGILTQTEIEEVEKNIVSETYVLNKLKDSFVEIEKYFNRK